jgi:hypothetical protein
MMDFVRQVVASTLPLMLASASLIQNSIAFCAGKTEDAERGRDACEPASQNYKTHA